MSSLPRRIAAVTLTAAALLGAAGAATSASAATVQYFRGGGPNPSAAVNRALSAAYAAGYTADQCNSEVDLVVPGYWRVVVTCVR
ncbi:hypothetical protein [Kitasatospora sp. NPDC093806]|uniref:hypothetical protein n=1 Tax=Kitasatospora sp. NPDC093806 TaxID=3155075 RepID=UPI003417A36B